MLTTTLSILLLAAVIGIVAVYFFYENKVDDLNDWIEDLKDERAKYVRRIDEIAEESANNRHLYEMNLDAANLKQQEIDRLQGILSLNGEAGTHTANRVEQLEDRVRVLEEREHLYLDYIIVAAEAINTIASNEAVAHNTARRLTNTAIEARTKLDYIRGAIFEATKDEVNELIKAQAETNAEPILF